MVQQVEGLAVKTWEPELSPQNSHINTEGEN